MHPCCLVACAAFLSIYEKTASDRCPFTCALLQIFSFVHLRRLLAWKNCLNGRLSILQVICPTIVLDYTRVCLSTSFRLIRGGVIHNLYFDVTRDDLSPFSFVHWKVMARWSCVYFLVYDSFYWLDFFVNCLSLIVNSLEKLLLNFLAIY